MAQDFQSFKDEVKYHADIVDVISGYVQLKKSGINFKGLCPFHGEKTPSFTVNPQKQIFHCFGCGEGGDVFTFLMKQERVGYMEAVQLLAERLGVKVPARVSGRGGEPPAKREAHRNILKSAKDFFSSCLEKSTPAREYLKLRGVSSDMVRDFSLGYCPEGWDTLYRHLRKNGYADGDIKEAAVVNVKDGRYYDVFRGRIIFPIMNTQGETVAFGGRAMGDAQPKYLNSSETDTFKKGRTLFGLNMAKDAIHATGHVILVEGYMDAIACFQNGFKNVVAPLGTALTDEHVKVIKRYTQTVLLVFDGDKAGISAARRAMAIVCKSGLTATAVLLPEGGDPDSFLKQKGPETFAKLLAAGKELVEFFIETGGPGTENIRVLYEIISSIDDTVLKGKLVTELSNKSSISETVLLEGIKKLQPQSQHDRTTAQKNSPETSSSSQKATRKLSDEEMLLSIYLSFPEEASSVKNIIDPDELDNILVKKIFSQLVEKKAEPTFDSISAVLAPEDVPILSRLMVEPSIDREMVEENIQWYVLSIKKHNIALALNELARKIEIAGSSGDNDSVTRLQKEQHELLAKKQHLDKLRPSQN